MKHTLIGAAALVISMSTAVLGDVSEIRNGVHRVSTHVWSNQLDPDEPVAAFPLGCVAEQRHQADDCDYTIWIDHLPGISGNEQETCRDDPTTRWFDCNTDPTCNLWVDFGPDVLPVIDWHGFQPDNPDPMTNGLIVTAFFDRPHRTNRSLFFTWQGHDAFHGWNYQTLRVIASEVEITDRELCRVGLAALYHVSSKALFGRGLLLPR